MACEELIHIAKVIYVLVGIRRSGILRQYFQIINQKAIKYNKLLSLSLLHVCNYAHYEGERVIFVVLTSNSQHIDCRCIR